MIGLGNYNLHNNYQYIVIIQCNKLLIEALNAALITPLLPESVYFTIFVKALAGHIPIG